MKTWGEYAEKDKVDEFERDLEAYIRESERMFGGSKWEREEDKKPRKVEEEKVHPLPEPIRAGASWQIHESESPISGGTNIDDRILVVPLGDSEQEVYVRDHEENHVAFSEGKTVEINKLGAIALAVEDARISMMARAAGWEEKSDPIINEQLTAALEKLKAMTYTDAKSRALTLALAAIASSGETENFKLIREKIKRSLDKNPKAEWNQIVRLSNKLAGRALSILGKPEAPHESGCKTCTRRKRSGLPPKKCIHPDKMLKASRWLAQWRETNKTYQTEMTGTSTCPGHGKPTKKKEPVGGFGTKWDPGPVEEGEFIPHGRKLPIIDDTDIWGTMNVQTPPRNRKVILRGKKAPMVYTRKMGVVPDRIHNWCSGRRVFSWTQPEGHKGGTILIDCSGSMGFSKEMLVEFIKAAPALTIAGYGGYADAGDLRIFIKDGRIVSDGYLGRPGAGNNTIDGPALRWLSKQKGPRFWISDGGVHGKSHPYGSAINLRQECQKFCNRMGIVNIPELNMAMRALVKHYGGTNKVVQMELED